MLIDEAQRQRLMDAIAAAMASVPEAIIRRALAHFSKADPAYGAGIAARLGLAVAAE
ncbi:MAG: catalase-related domain-containing protein [Rhodospirillales bacterium]